MAARADVGRERDLLARRARDLEDPVDELLAVVDPGQLADRLAAHDRQQPVDVARERQVAPAALHAAGVEQAIGSRTFAKLEYRYSNYNNADFQFRDGTTTSKFDIDTDRHQVVAGVGIRF